MSKLCGKELPATAFHSSGGQTPQPTSWQILESPEGGSQKPETQLPSFTIWAGGGNRALDTKAWARTKIQLKSRPKRDKNFENGFYHASWGMAIPPRDLGRNLQLRGGVRPIARRKFYFRYVSKAPSHFGRKNGDSLSWVCLS